MKKFLLLFCSCLLALLVISPVVIGATGKKMTPEQVKNIIIQPGGLSVNDVIFVKKAKTNSKDWEVYLFHIKQGNVKQPVLIFVDNRGNAVFGKIMMANNTMVMPNLSQEDLSPKIDNIDVSKLNKENRIVLNPSGQKTLYMFYSPECPHCKQAMERLVNYKGEYKIIVKFMVSPIIPSKAKDELTDYLVKNKHMTKEEASKLADKLIEEDFKEGMEAGIMGTPMFFDEKGKYYPFVPDARE